MSQGGIDTLDTANMQKLVNVLAMRHAVLDREEKNLEQSLKDMESWWLHETDSSADLPFQFTKEGMIEFMDYKIPVSRAMYAVDRLVMYQLTELHKYERGDADKLPEPFFTKPESEIPDIAPMKVEVNTTQPRESISAKLQSLTRQFKTRKIPTPYELFLDSIEYTGQIKKKWHLILHWYYLTAKKRATQKPEQNKDIKLIESQYQARLGINTRQGLDNLLEQMYIVFSFYIEPNLVMAVRYSKELAGERIEDKSSFAISSYLQAKQRNRQPIQMM